MPANSPCCSPACAPTSACATATSLSAATRPLIGSDLRDLVRRTSTGAAVCSIRLMLMPPPKRPAPGMRQIAALNQPARLSRKLLLTTMTLESAIAAEASTGESNPMAATGIPTVL